MKNRGYINNDCKNSVIIIFHLSYINKLKPPLFFRTLQYMCRTDPAVDWKNQQTAADYLLVIDHHAKKQSCTDVDSDIGISDDEEHEQ